MFSIIHQVIIIILDVSQCETDTCSGNGECVHDTDGLPFCKCDEGWTNTNCNISIYDCEENICLYDGTCVDGHLGFTCICPPYRTGYRCSEGKITGINVDFLSLNHVIVISSNSFSPTVFLLSCGSHIHAESQILTKRNCLLCSCVGAFD